MAHVYYEDNKVYSVDMMIAYINIYKPPVKHIAIEDYSCVMSEKVWGDPEEGTYSPVEVINSKKKKAFAEDLAKIKNANMKYPIIVTHGVVIDGIHRFTKAYLRGDKKIRAYEFTKQQMKLFQIGTEDDWEKVFDIGIHEYIEMFHNRMKKLK